jgi:hypothetical protein
MATTVAFLNTFSVLALVLGALFLSLIAVLLDRINFPQRRFRPKQIRTTGRGSSRDRTGAHVVEVPTDEF